MIDYFKIENNDLIKDLSLIFKSKMYEMVLKSIIYFFENVNFPEAKNKEQFKEKIPHEYENLSNMDLDLLRKSLKDLQTNEIYDYEQPKKNYKFFTSFYEKKEAIDF